MKTKQVNLLKLSAATLLLVAAHQAEAGSRVGTPAGTLTVLSPGWGAFFETTAPKISSNGEVLVLNLRYVQSLTGMPDWITPVYWDGTYGLADWFNGAGPGANWGVNRQLFGISGDGNLAVGVDERSEAYSLSLRTPQATLQSWGLNYQPLAAGTGWFSSVGIAGGRSVELRYNGFWWWGQWYPGGAYTLPLSFSSGATVVASDTLDLVASGRQFHRVSSGQTLTAQSVPTSRWTPDIRDVAADGSWLAGAAVRTGVSTACVWDATTGTGRTIGGVPYTSFSTEASGVSDGATVVVGTALKFRPQGSIYFPEPVAPIIARAANNYTPEWLTSFLAAQGFPLAELQRWQFLTADSVSANGLVIAGRCRSMDESSELYAEGPPRDLIYVLELPKPIIDFPWPKNQIRLKP